MKKNGYPCCEQWPSNKMVGLKKKKKYIQLPTNIYNIVSTLNN